MNGSPLVRVPLITSVCLLTLTSCMPPSFTCSRNVEYGMSCTAPDRALKLLTTVATTTAITIHRTMFLARSFKVASSERDGSCRAPAGHRAQGGSRPDTTTTRSGNAITGSLHWELGSGCGFMDMKWEHSSRIKGARQQIKFRTALPRGRRLAHLDRPEQPPQPLNERLEVPPLEHFDQEVAAGRERLGREIARQPGQVHRAVLVDRRNPGRVRRNVGHHQLRPVRAQQGLQLLEHRVVSEVPLHEFHSVN